MSVLSARALPAVAEKASVAVRSAKRADIQGLRAVAVLLVVVYHAGVDLPGGFTGVDVFFAISGFVITSVLISKLADSGRLSLPRFYARRVKRLLPALALMFSDCQADFSYARAEGRAGSIVDQSNGPGGCRAVGQARIRRPSRALKLVADGAMVHFGKHRRRGLMISRVHNVCRQDI